MIIVDELPHHASAIDTLLDRSFGPDRHLKTVYKLRAGVEPVAGLSLVTLAEDGSVIGTIRYWPVLLAGQVPSLMLGPVATSPEWRSRGIGSQLIRRSLNRAAVAGHRSVILVGDAPLYQPFGFVRETVLGLDLPGPVDLQRFLGLELVEGSLTGLCGAVERWDDRAAALAATLAPARSRPLISRVKAARAA